MGVYIGEPTVISDMQGPAPAGFHVPLNTEWQAVCDILITTFGLSKNATTMGTYLKMPMAGYRGASSGNVNSVRSTGYCWSSTPHLTSSANMLSFSSSSIIQNTGYRPLGYSVRCFKNSPAVPTASWIILYDGSSVASGAGVFWNSTDGLISVSGDGTTWYTIMDKNLGATIVFSQGDTLTDANCGYFYQRGNNYGFPHSGTVTTSSTKVDASNYGPGNYYSSSTFITGSGDWSSVQNDNLWGGVTQGTTTKSTDLKNAYIGEYQEEWQPGANTVLYCPLKDDILDHSGNHTMTMTTSTYGTVAKDSTGFYYFNGGYISSESYSGPITAGTLSTWVKKSSSKSGGDSRFTWSVSAHYRGSSPFHCGLAFNYGGYGGQNGEFHAGATSGTSGKSISGPTMGSWELWTMTYDNTVGAKFYRNGVYEDSFSNTNNLRNDSLPTFIGATNPYTDQYLDGYLSDVIIEDKARTAQEIQDYYNLTKGNYGL